MQQKIKALIILALVLAGLLIVMPGNAFAATAAVTSPLMTTRPYSATSPWNTPISSPVYDPHSADMVAMLKQTRNGGAITSDPTVYTYPVFWAVANNPKRTA